MIKLKLKDTIRYIKDLAVNIGYMAIAMFMGNAIGFGILKLFPHSTIIGSGAPMVVPDVLDFFLAMLIIGISEEGMFRYLLQDRILTKLFKAPHWMAIGLASVVFGCAHFMNPGSALYNLPQVIGATFCGVLLGYQYFKRDFLFVILVHACYDALIFALYFGFFVR